MSRIRPRAFPLLLLSGLLTLAAACGKDSSTAPTPQPPPPTVTPVPTRITITPASTSLTTIGQTVQLSAQVFDQKDNAMTGTALAWTSRDPGVASVSTAGLVTAVKYGITHIRARSGNAAQDAEVKVTQTAGRIEIEPAEASLMAIGETVQLVAKVLDLSGQNIEAATVTWRSSDEAVASVGDDGLVTAVGNGTARITARSGGTEQSVTVKVMLTPTGIKIDPPEATLTAIGETIQLAAMVVDLNDRTIKGATATWRSSDESVASVSDDGLVTAVENGVASVTATRGDLSESIDVTVRQTPASIVIDPDRVILAEVGRTMRLTATVLDPNGHKIEGAEVTWSSSDEAIATVDYQGLVAAVGSGTAEITAQSGEVSSVSLISVKGTGLDRKTLTALYHATNGDEWTNNDNWLSTAPLGAWHGITTNFAGEVTGIQLKENNLRGPIPAELYRLSALERLELPWNELTGNIPPELGLLTNLHFLWLASNELTGNIPPELGLLANLNLLWLEGNRLTGVIPSEFGQLTSLRSLRIGSTELTGVLPPELGQLTSLGTISLLNNKLYGNIPPELGQLFNLEYLELDGNEFTGTIPHELGQLTKLVRLGLTGNQLTGDIPLELTQLTDLTSLSLSSNRLTGNIPPELARLTNLEDLSLSKNGLTGNIPPELGQLTYLESLALRQNALTGNIPPELAQLTNLDYLSLSKNGLTGNIPPELGQLSKLRELRLGQNRLTGNIPPELGQLGSLAVLALDDNRLTGGIPDELGRLTNLIWLWLEQNPGLKGPLPESFTGLTSITWLTLYNAGLCVPSTSDFRTWIDGIERKSRLLYCTDP